MLLSDVGAYLVATTSLGLNYGSSTGNLFLGGFSEQSPDSATALAEYPGREPLRAMAAAYNSVPVAERPRLQVIVRDSSTASYGVVRAQAEAVYQRLDAAGEFTGASGTRYLNIVCLQPPFKLELDDSNRLNLAWNIEVWKERG